MGQENQEPFEQYPISIVLMRLALVLAWLASGLGLAAELAPLAALALLAATLGLGLFLLAGLCRNCAYHGLTCDTGAGRLAALAFSAPGDRRRFRRNALLAAPFLVLLALAFVAAGGCALWRDFSLGLLLLFCAHLAAGSLFVLTSRTLACARCRMRGQCPLSLNKPIYKDKT